MGCGWDAIRGQLVSFDTVKKNILPVIGVCDDDLLSRPAPTNIVIRTPFIFLQGESRSEAALFHLRSQY